MQALQWNAITPNFSGSAQESADATRNFATAGNLAASIQRNILAKDAADRQAKEDDLAQQQQQFANNLATQANARRQWVAQASGMGQGALVTNAMKNITSKTNGLDNTNAMKAMSNEYTSVGVDPKLTTLISKIDAYNTANGIDGVNKQQTTATERAALGNNYNEYIALQNNVSNKIDQLNNNVADSDYSGLFQTTNPSKVKNVLTNQLINGGVNPLYAAKEAAAYAGKYTSIVPKMTAVAKAKMKLYDNIMKQAEGNTSSVKNTVSKGLGLEGTKNGNIGYVNMTRTPNIKNTVTNLTAMLKAIGVGDSKVPWHDDASKLNQYVNAATTPIQPVDVNGKPLRDASGKLYPMVYPTQNDVNKALLLGVKTHWMSGNSLYSPATFKDQLAREASATILKHNGIAFKTGTQGTGAGAGTKTTTSSTVKNMTPSAQQNYLAALNAEQSLLNAYSVPTGKSIADRIMGVNSKGKISGYDYSKEMAIPTKAPTNSTSSTSSNPLLKALNSKSPTAVANIVANTNNVDKLNSMISSLSGKDRHRFEKIVNGKGNLISKLLKAKYPDIKTPIANKRVNVKPTPVSHNVYIPGVSRAGKSFDWANSSGNTLAELVRGLNTSQYHKNYTPGSPRNR